MNDIDIDLAAAQQALDAFLVDNQELKGQNVAGSGTHYVHHNDKDMVRPVTLAHF